VTFTRKHPSPVPLEVGVYVASLDAPFELRASRPTYSAPISVREWLGEGKVVRDLPDWTADDWSGLKGFLRIQVLNDSGNVVENTRTTFCPDGYDLQRVNDSGPDRSPYPPFCPINPFTLGSVWGIEQGWATNINDPFTGPPLYIDGPDGRYTARFSITRPYRQLFNVRRDDATTEVGVTLKTQRRSSGTSRSPRSDPAPALSGARAPEMRHPDPSLLPDLIPLPAWHMQAEQHGGADYLNFGATVWNAGASPLVVEGFRREGTDVMDAFQYFYKDGKPVGRAPVGTLEYDARRGHEHWHFPQFARYTLLDSSKRDVVVSGKEAFCLAPTDPIDLTRPGANWDPDQIGVSTACGDRNSIWTRETLDAGWGDTYLQFLPGQSFDISKVPNGRYFIKVEANPRGRLHERSTSNNVTLRRIILRGRPGHRKVRVPRWHGIDSEGDIGGGLPF
jgi:hypothetical protein